MTQRAFFLLFLFLTNYALSAQVDLQQIDQYIEKAVDDWGVPGLSVAIVKDGQIVLEKGYGVKELGKSEKVDEHTLYAIASNTKAFTSAMIAQLVDEGKLDWDDRVQLYLPYFQLHDPSIASQVTVRDLLAHRVGLGTFYGDAIWYKSNFTPKEIVERVRHIPLSYPFRSGYGYSNLMYITAGVLIEAVTGKSWSENVQERLLDRVGMSRTVASVNKLNEKGNYAIPHKFSEGSHQPIPWVGWDNVQATGGLLSSVHDMGLWLIANLNHGELENDTLFSAAARTQMWTAHTNLPVNQSNPNPYGVHWTAYGLGWFLGDYQGVFRVRHGGGYDGMISTVQLLPDYQLGVVVLTNGVRVPTNAIAYYIFDRYLDRPEKDWSSELLNQVKKAATRDTRITDAQAKRKVGTEPTFKMEQMVGIYQAPKYGEIQVLQEKDQLVISFSHSPGLKATLSHWHYDTYRMDWQEPQAWFSFGTVTFTADSDHEVKGIEFYLPNDDIFLEELNATKK